MADVGRTQWVNFLYEMKGKIQQVFPTEAPFLAELSGVGDSEVVGRYTRDMDANRTVFSGKWVRHPIVLAMLPGGGFVSETGTWNVPHVLGTTEAQIKLVDIVQPFSVTVDVERDSFDNSAAAAVERMMDEARVALARIENQAFLGDGTGLVETMKSATGSGSLVVDVGTTANFDILLPGTVWDFLTRTTGADPGNGLRRKIASVQEAAGTITLDTAAQASDGGSGNLTFAATTGAYIPGSWTASASAGTLTSQGLEQAAATTGTFENIDKAAVQQWQGSDGRSGDTAVVPLSDQILDKAVRVGRRAGLGKWDFGLGDPAVIDLYKGGKLSQVRYEESSSKIKSGFKGIVYDGADAPITLIKEPVMKRSGVRLIDKASFQLYGDQAGPAFLDDDGAVFRRFARSLPKEADLLDRVQLGVLKCNTLVFINNLQRA